MKEDNKVLRIDSMSNHRMPLNIQLFADGDDDGNNDSNVNTEAVKFGNVEFTPTELESLPEDVRSKLGLANDSYKSSRQQVTDLGVTNKTLADKVSVFEKNNENNNENNNEKISPGMKILMDKISSLEGRVSGEAINTHEMQSKSVLTTKYGATIADEIIKSARIEFDKKFTEPSQRTTDVFDLFVNQHIAGKTDSMLEGRYDISNNKSFARMMEDPAFKSQAEKYAKEVGAEGVNFLMGSNDTMEAPLEGEALQEKIKDMSRPERTKFMIEQARLNQVRQGRNKFVK